MPIRIPQIVAQNQLDVTPTPRADPGSVALPYRAIEGLAEGISQAAANYNKVNQKLTERDMELDVKSKLTRARDLLSQEAIALQQEGIEPDQIAPTFEKRGQKVMQDLMRDLKYPGSAREFQVKADDLLTTEVINQRRNALDLKYARISVLSAGVVNEKINQAVWGTEAEQKAAIADINEELNKNLSTGVWNAAKTESEMEKAASQIQEGRATRDFQNPRKRTETIVMLRRGQFPGLSPAKQLALADEFERKEEAIATAQKKEIKEAEDKFAAETHKEVVDLITSREFGRAKLALANGRRFLRPAEYEHLTTTITKQETMGGPSDPDTLKQMRLEVHSITTDPVTTLTRLQMALERGLVTGEDFTPLANHVEARIKAKKEGDPLLARQHAQAEQNLREALRVTGPAAAVLDSAAQSIYTLGLEDLTRNSAYFGKGNENPLDWYDRRKAYYVARLGTVANQRLGDLNKQLKDGNGQAYATGDPKADTQALMQRRGTFREGADFWDQMRILRESHELRKAMQELQGRGGQYPVPTQPSLPPPSPSTPPTGAPGQGQKLGRTPPKG